MKPSDRLTPPPTAFLDAPSDQLERAAQAAGFSLGEEYPFTRHGYRDGAFYAERKGVPVPEALFSERFVAPEVHTIADDTRDDWIFFAVMIGLVVFVAVFVAVGIVLLGWWR